MPVSPWLMRSTFWWKSMSWFVSIAKDLAGRNNPLIFGLSISCGHDRQLACYKEAVITLHCEYCELSSRFTQPIFVPCLFITQCTCRYWVRLLLYGKNTMQTEAEVLTDRNIIRKCYLPIIKAPLAEMVLSGIITTPSLSWFMCALSADF